jgi:hypothetical protein
MVEQCCGELPRKNKMIHHGCQGCRKTSLPQHGVITQELKKLCRIQIIEVSQKQRGIKILVAEKCSWFLYVESGRNGFLQYRTGFRTSITCNYTLWTMGQAAITNKTKEVRKQLRHECLTGMTYAQWHDDDTSGTTYNTGIRTLQSSGHSQNV